MMVLALGNLRVDEWMDSITRSFDVIDLSRAKNSIRSLCEGWHLEEHAHINGTHIDIVNKLLFTSSNLASEQSAA